MPGPQNDAPPSPMTSADWRRLISGRTQLRGCRGISPPSNVPDHPRSSSAIAQRDLQVTSLPIEHLTTAPPPSRKSVYASLVPRSGPLIPPPSPVSSVPPTGEALRPIATPSGASPLTLTGMHGFGSQSDWSNATAAAPTRRAGSASVGSCTWPGRFSGLYLPPPPPNRRGVP